jgi:hypothetical protein
MIENKDPFGYPLTTYLWVLGLALIGGAVKYLNQSTRFSWLLLVRDLVTAGFAGLMTFWICEWAAISGPLSAVLISTSGLMGTRALREIENLYRLRLGLPLENEGMKVEVKVKTDEKEVEVHVEGASEPAMPEGGKEGD